MRKRVAKFHRNCVVFSWVCPKFTENDIRTTNREKEEDLGSSKSLQKNLRSIRLKTSHV